MKFTLGVGSNNGMVQLWKDIVLITSPRRLTTLKFQFQNLWTEKYHVLIGQ